jgi:hypothetical protein
MKQYQFEREDYMKKKKLLFNFFYKQLDIILNNEAIM